MPIPPPMVEPLWTQEAPVLRGPAWTAAAAAPGGWADRLLGLAASIVQSSTSRGGRAAAQDAGSALATAVSAIVAIAAQRALAHGDLPRLRAMIERALDAADPQPDRAEEPGLPPIADADPQSEAPRLSALLRRQAG